jgi:protein FAM32A
MSGFVGGKLKLKGGDPKGVTKKKKKKSTGSEAALALATAGSGDAADGLEGSKSAAEPVKTKDGFILPAPSATEDRRTEAQKRHDERVRKLEEERLRKLAVKGYRDRVKDFNEHLAGLSEHHDIPKVGGAGSTVLHLSETFSQSKGTNLCGLERIQEGIRCSLDAWPWMLGPSHISYRRVQPYTSHLLLGMHYVQGPAAKQIILSNLRGRGRLLLASDAHSSAVCRLHHDSL